MRRVLIFALLAATLTACASEPAAPEMSKPEHVRAKFRVVGNPAADLPDAQIERVAKAACDLVEAHGGNTAILDTLATKTPLPGYTTSQVLQLNIFAAQVYCPEIVGEGYLP